MVGSTQNKTIVACRTEGEETYVKKRGWFFIFPITWYEKIKTEYFGNDIEIISENEIRAIYFNGKKIWPITPLS